MTALTKSQCKTLAAEIAKLRPPEPDTNAFQVWAEMVDLIAEHVAPGHLTEAFSATCRSHGVWATRYEGKRGGI